MDYTARRKIQNQNPGQSRQLNEAAEFGCLRLAGGAMVMRLKLMYVVFLFFLAGTLGAQVTTAKFYGIVTDSSGARLPGTSLTLIHEGTGTTLTGTTNELGEFAFDFLRVGSYTMR